jgi:acetylornithine deacetylase
VSANDAAELLSSLIAIDSQNPALVDGVAGEAAIAAFCVDWLRARGVDAWIEAIGDGTRCNAVARVSGRGSATKRVLALCAHLDTVSVAGMAAPLQARVEDGRVYGRGAYDMKSGVAACMMALAELAADPPACTVLGAFVADEEYASAGAFDFVARHRTDACIVTEPSEGRLILAHKGFVWVEIETAGIAAHGSRWQDGMSAIGRMGRIIAALETFSATTLRERKHLLLGPPSLHCAVVEGGVGWSTYAPRCVLRVERRTLPGETPRDVLTELREVIAAAGEAAEVREVLSRAPLECAPDSAIASAVRAAAAEAVGIEPVEAGVAYWMDAAVFAAAGAEAVNYGPTGAGAHAAVEWAELDSVTRCARVLAGAARRYSATAAPRTEAHADER